MKNRIIQTSIIGFGYVLLMTLFSLITLPTGMVSLSLLSSIPAALLLLKIYYRDSGKSLNIELSSRDFMVGLLVAGGAILVGFGVAILFTLIGASGSSGSSSIITERTGLDLALTTVGVVIAAPIAEEIVFRGILYDVWNGRKNPFGFLIGSMLIFGVLHADFGSGLLFALYSIISTGLAGGLVFGIAYLKTRNLFAPIIGHMIYNLLVVIGLFI